MEGLAVPTKDSSYKLFVGWDKRQHGFWYELFGETGQPLDSDRPHAHPTLAALLASTWGDAKWLCPEGEAALTQLAREQDAEFLSHAAPGARELVRRAQAAAAA